MGDKTMKNKVTIIGAGTVGASIAYTLAARDLASDILLIDINEAKAEMLRQYKKYFDEVKKENNQ